MLAVFTAPLRIILGHTAATYYNVITLFILKHFRAGIAVYDSSDVFGTAFWALVHFLILVRVLTA